MHSSRKHTIRNTAGWLITLLIILQLIPLDRKNPPETAPLVIRGSEGEALENACYSCHSFTTRRKPGIAWIAPVSWIMNDAVRRGRDTLNFSIWEMYSAKEQRQHLKAMTSIVNGNKKHAGMLRILFPENEMTAAGRMALLNWIEKEHTK